MAGLSKIRFKVVHFTSEDPDYPASQLNEVVPTTRGWQSVRFCTYPQELGFQILDGEVRITQLQVLSHQSKISSKVEIFVGRGASYASATFKRLGYLSLDSNEKSNFQARELKTVFVDNACSFLKLLLYENHVNKVNSYNQVGIVGLCLLGTDEVDESKPHRPEAKPLFKNPYNDLTIDINLDPQTASKLRQLAEAKAKAISNEDYLVAKQIKTVEQELKALGSRLAQLDMAKAEAVAAEDYDLAKEIKDECDGLRIEIERKIRAIDIPGVRLQSPMPPPKRSSRTQAGEVSEPEYRGSGADVPFDELPVGGKKMASPRSDAGGLPHLDSFHSAGKKAVRVELLEHPGRELGGSPSAKGAGLPPAAAELGVSEGDRPIRPMHPGPDSSGLGGEEGDGGLTGGLTSTGMPIEQFPPGEHPLEGVPGFLELPTPEMLSSKSREYAESTGITRLLGEYRARCLFSRSWNVREACVVKVRNLLATEIGRDAAGLAAAMSALCAVVKVGVEDKIQQVLFSSVKLLDALLRAVATHRLGRGAVLPAMEPVLVQLVDKLADGNARLREGARNALDLLAASPAVGPAPLAAQLVKPLPPRHKTGWRPLATRLQILADLVLAHGMGASGLQVDALVGFPKAAQAFAHSNKEVRDAARDLIVAIQRCVGTGPLEATLALLRKNQREEYEAAFESGHKQAAGGKAPPKASALREDESSPPRRGDSKPAASSSSSSSSSHHHHHAAGGKVPTSSHKVQQHKDGYGSAADEPGEQQDFTSCMFCGVQNPAWQENDLDLHYWKDCPLLFACPACAQIVEIAGLPEHLLEECDSRDSYEPCEVTGLAIRKSEFDQWRRSAKCVPAPSNCMYCPLCFSTVEDSDDAWMTHLSRKCPKNTRITVS